MIIPIYEIDNIKLYLAPVRWYESFADKGGVSMTLFGNKELTRPAVTGWHLGITNQGQPELAAALRNTELCDAFVCLTPRPKGQRASATGAL
ncbi:hypothetical protein CSC82_04695 [Rhodobacteraceae bacterium 4F10]|nr:hypothetical protein CSC82_04695 [Rhodobacteraceae bacterium 4F10]